MQYKEFGPDAAVDVALIKKSERAITSLIKKKLVCLSLKLYFCSPRPARFSNSLKVHSRGCVGLLKLIASAESYKLWNRYALVIYRVMHSLHLCRY